MSTRTVIDRVLAAAVGSSLQAAKLMNQSGVNQQINAPAVDGRQEI